MRIYGTFRIKGEKVKEKIKKNFFLQKIKKLFFTIKEKKPGPFKRCGVRVSERAGFY